MVAEDGVEAVLLVAPYDDVAEMTGEVQAAIAESVLSWVRKFWQPSLIPEGIRGFPDEDDVPDGEDAAKADVVSNVMMVKYFIVFEVLD